VRYTEGHPGGFLLPPFVASGGNRFVALQVRRDGALEGHTRGTPQSSAPFNALQHGTGGAALAGVPARLADVPARLAGLLEEGVPAAQCARVHALEEGLAELWPCLVGVSRLLAAQGLPSLPAEVSQLDQARAYSESLHSTVQNITVQDTISTAQHVLAHYNIVLYRPPQGHSPVLFLTPFCIASFHLSFLGRPPWG